MTPNENVEVVGRCLEAIGEAQVSGAWGPVLAELDPEVEMDDFDTVIDTEHYLGHDGFLKWMSTWNESWDSWRLDDVEVLPAGESDVIAQFVMFATGAGSGMELERPDAVTFKLREGKIVEIAYYNDQNQAREALGLVST
jgi:ketosteroid isomerase-like protein